MSEPFLGSIRIFGFNFAPRGYATADGQILPINQNQSLFSLYGTTYGGDGRTTFGLPDLRGRVPIHLSSAYPLGNKSGAESVTLSAAEMPSHTHAVSVSQADGTAGTPQDNLFATATANVGTVYSDTNANLDTNLASTAIQNSGGQAHDNMMPYLTINFCVALQGLFPSRN